MKKVVKCDIIDDYAVYNYCNYMTAMKIVLLCK